VAVLVKGLAVRRLEEAHGELALRIVCAPLRSASRPGLI
jgi:hypothetical protein